MSKTKKPEVQFKGYSNPNYTMVPDELFDEQLPYLSGAELKVLLYIIRRTFGFKKESDSVSLNQMTNGIVTKDGRVLDKGTGLSKAAVALAVRSLEEKGLILRNRMRSSEKGDEPTTYALNILPVSNNWTPPLPKNGHPPVQNLDTQETVLQETVKQDIDPSNLRKAEKEKTDYVNLLPEDNGQAPTQSTRKETEQQKPESRAKTQRDGSEEKQRPSKHRNIEEPQRKETYPPARERMHKPQPSRTASPGLVSVGDLLPQQFIAKPVADDEAYQAIRDFIRDMAGKNHDEASLKSSTTRAYNLYQRAGVSLSYFFNLVYEADREASRRSTSIKKRTADGFTNRMAYFFAVLEDKLGLREKLPPANP
jgi:DNA-binding MarR family transcriptional regulator